MLPTLTRTIRTKLNEAAAPVVVTVSGPSGSGKTSVVHQIIAILNIPAVILHTDDYYIGKTRMKAVMPDGEEQNFDHPVSIDLERLADDLRALCSGKAIDAPIYDMFFSEPKKDRRHVEPEQLIIVEGIAANLPSLKDRADISVCVTAPDDERLRRCTLRDYERNGRSTDEERDYFLRHVEPSYETYFAPADRQVDFTIQN